MIISTLIINKLNKYNMATSAPIDMTGINTRIRPANGDGEPVGQRLRTQDNSDEDGGVYSSNLRTLRTTSSDVDAKDFMRRYYSNLVGMKAGLPKMYFDKSCLTFNGVEVMGENPIMIQLATHLRECPFYNMQYISAQPTLGNGIFIIVKGDSPGHLFTMTFNIVSVKKKYRILNQYIEFYAKNVAAP